MRRTAAATAAFLIAAGAFFAGAASAQEGDRLGIAQHPEFGAYLVDENGLSLYLFEEDRREGERGRSVESDCIDGCLARWPTVGGDPMPTAGEGVDPALIGAFVRPDGKTQATYGGWPLYTFAEDFLAGDVYGHDFEEFGGEWYLITPAGRAVGHPDEGFEHEDDDDNGRHGRRG